MRLLYLCLGYLLTPIAFGVHLWRGLGDRRHWAHLGERYGFGPRVPPGGFWLHAVSVGEVKAAQPLIDALRHRYAALPITLTTSTVTGRAEALRLYGAGVTVRYLPYDLPGPVNRFLAEIRPVVALVLETELWPILYRGCARVGLPIVLISARLSERSVRRYRGLGGLIRTTLQSISAIGAQTPIDAERFMALGAHPERTTVMGNLKFDVTLPDRLHEQGAQLRSVLGDGRFVWVAGSTHEGEEALLLDAHRQLRQRYPDALLVLAPRHPQRFGHVKALLEQQATRFVTRSTQGRVMADTEVLLLDTLGELNLFYAAANVAFVAGSLKPIGGHNVLEPAMLGKPVLVGPEVATVRAAVDLLRAAGALEIITDGASLVERLCFHAESPASSAEAAAQGLEVLSRNRGCTARAMAMIDTVMSGRIT